MLHTTNGHMPPSGPFPGAFQPLVRGTLTFDTPTSPDPLRAYLYEYGRSPGDRSLDHFYFLNILHTLQEDNVRSSPGRPLYHSESFDRVFPLYDNRHPGSIAIHFPCMTMLQNKMYIPLGIKLGYPMIMWMMCMNS